MKTTYRVIAWTIAVLVVVQAAAMVFAISGLFSFIDAGGVVDANLSTDAIPEGAGIGIHSVVGGMVLPALALILLLLSFFTRDRRRIWTAAALLALIVLETFLGYSGWSSPIAGALHGANALLLFGVALAAALGRGPGQDRVGQRPAPEDAAAATTSTGSAGA